MVHPFDIDKTIKTGLYLKRSAVWWTRLFCCLNGSLGQVNRYFGARPGLGVGNLKTRVL
jgi:hypothetical protein